MLLFFPAVRFEVDVLEGDLATLCGIAGKKTLLVSKSDLAFEDPVTKRIIFSFSFAWMRRYGTHDKNKFQFEVGRKCPNGAGAVDLITSLCKDIHQMVTKNSKNTSITKTPHAPEQISKKSDNVSDKLTTDKSGIVGPSVVTNIGRKHPGKTNVPTLIPLPAHNSERNGNGPPTPTKEEANSRDSLKERDGDHVSNKFKKELEHKLVDDGSKKGSVKDGKKLKDSKKEKKEKEEREKKEREQEKERKKKDKEQKKKEEKEEKKPKSGLFSFKKDKKEKENKEPEKAENILSSNSVFHSGNLYEEPDLLQIPSKPVKTNEALYSVADVPTDSKPPVGFECDSEVLYDEAISVSRGSAPPEPVEYAQPSITSAKGLKSDVYSDARDIEKSPTAWQQFARKEDEECHTENYSSIKDARNMLSPPPPIPQRCYDEEDDDDTYDRTDRFQSKGVKGNTENIYGTASGPVGSVVAVPMANKGSDSEEEDLYDNPDVEEGYETAGKQQRRLVVEAYEEADAMPAFTKPKPKPKPKPNYGNEQLYEDIR